MFFVPEEGMTGGGTGGRDLDRRENAEAEGGAECWLTATRADMASPEGPPHLTS